MANGKSWQMADKYDMIDPAMLQEMIQMAERKKYLEDVHIWQGQNGNWFCKILKDGQKKLVKRKSRKGLEDEIVRIRKDEENRPTVKRVYEEWICKKLEYGEITESTKDRYQKDYRRFIAGTDLEGRNFAAVLPKEWEDFIKKVIADKKLTSKGYAGLRTLLRGMMIYAKGRYTDMSPEILFSDLSFSKNTFRKNILFKEKQVYMEDEAKILSAYLKKSNAIHALGILLVFQTGLRVGELSSLRVSDIIKEEGLTFLHIQRTETRIPNPSGGHLYIIADYPKSSAGDRYVFCNKEAEDILSKIIAKANGEYLFCNKKGRMNGGMFDRFLRRSCDKCNLPHKSMHKIRKTYGTMLIDAGVDEAIIIEQMGHSDIHCTKQYYYFSNKSRKKKSSQLSAVNTIW